MKCRDIVHSANVSVSFLPSCTAFELKEEFFLPLFWSLSTSMIQNGSGKR